jgi:hypothetical protein
MKLLKSLVKIFARLQEAPFKNLVVIQESPVRLALSSFKINYKHRSASRTSITGNGTCTGPGIGAGAGGFWAGSGLAPTGRFWADRSGPVCAGLGRLVSIWAGWCRSEKRHQPAPNDTNRRQLLFIFTKMSKKGIL